MRSPLLRAPPDKPPWGDTDSLFRRSMMLRVTGRKLLPAFAAVAITALLGSNVAQAQNQELVLES
jgi:hypothetical protein